MSPKTSRLRSYQSLWRMAKVRESLAAAELAKTTAEEREHQQACTNIQSQRDALTRAGEDGLAASGHLDLTRLEMLSLLDAAMGERQARAEQALAEVEQRRAECAQANWQAKRYRERVGEQLKETRDALYQEHAAKAQEESIELWTERRKGDA